MKLVNIYITLIFRHSGWADIAFNYIVGGNAAVFIGRGPTYVGATAKGYGILWYILWYNVLACFLISVVDNCNVYVLQYQVVLRCQSHSCQFCFCFHLITFSWNRKSISIAFIGDFIYHAPSDEVLNSLDGWLDYLTQTNVLTQNFTLYGLCQVRTLFPDSPGAAFLAEIERRFPGHWVSTFNTPSSSNSTST